MPEHSQRTRWVRRDVLNEILRLSWPAVLEQILIMMSSLFVTMFLGHYGTSELAAAGLVNIIMAVLQTAFAGLATGSTIIIARLVGMGEELKARNTLYQSMLISIALSVPVTLASSLAAAPILQFFFHNIGGETQALAEIYYHYILLSMPFLALDMTVSASMRGAGDTFSPMLVTGSGNIVTMLLCLLLVRRSGIAGAGVAILASRILTLGLRLAILFFRRRRLYLSPRESYHLEWALVSRIVRQGLPAFLEQLIMQGGFLMNNAILASLGTVILATWHVGVNINALAYMPIFGLSVATITGIGQALGAGKISEAEDYSRESLRLGIAIITLFGVLTAIFAEPLARLFTNDPEVISRSIILIRFFSIVEPLIAIVSICASILRGGGDILFVTLSSFVGLWVFRVGLAFMLVKLTDIGLYGVMVGTGCDFAVRAALYGLRVRGGRWKTKRV